MTARALGTLIHYDRAVHGGSRKPPEGELARQALQQLLEVFALGEHVGIREPPLHLDRVALREMANVADMPAVDDGKGGAAMSLAAAEKQERWGIWPEQPDDDRRVNVLPPSCEPRHVPPPLREEVGVVPSADVDEQKNRVNPFDGAAVLAKFWASAVGGEFHNRRLGGRARDWAAHTEPLKAAQSADSERDEPTAAGSRAAVAAAAVNPASDGLPLSLGGGSAPEPASAPGSRLAPSASTFAARPRSDLRDGSVCGADDRGRFTAFAAGARRRAGAACSAAESSPSSLSLARLPWMVSSLICSYSVRVSSGGATAVALELAIAGHAASSRCDLAVAVAR
eukprot:CAMPEP_0179930220 /NCGR_PEP_ID=MMETSP0983-20121128/9912_1 /TAXON_ID=483367 /ORGANISM="non described non described, Strain CCMP 2436" /LENGTH=339 /DNA_ID=CAMNT_0021834331 /DNA_START=171 /DNA_END=1187 /DNA_ORIENTATION=-